MAIQLPIQLAPGLATVVAALLASVLTFAGLVLAKEQKISEFRQAWIDGLRVDLSILFSSIRSMCRAMEEKSPGMFLLANGVGFDQESILELRRGTSEAYYKVLLRLNVLENKHLELLKLIDDALRKCNEIAPSLEEIQSVEEAKNGTATNLSIIEISIGAKIKTKVKIALDTLDESSKYSTQILKSEWARVKKGEKNFQIALYGVPALFIFVAFLFFAMFSFEWVKFYDPQNPSTISQPSAPKNQTATAQKSAKP
ncbi:hypothetical protein [Undibacterium umbellatum]|uniref:Uncharacterized protein n=1 Tax=Undibacterium umbellatum TaxID=2762300 RepID=A0ABR6Z4E2_9BURK|nr:hypothetical protein [Undibacterium umbellatum]MBC3906181.1 hypothetical protein [Undibacterium umbellatum]